MVVWASHCGGFFYCGAQALEHRLNNCGVQTRLLQGMWDLPKSGIEPWSPALAGRFFATEPPGKPGSTGKFLLVLPNC